MPSLPDDAGFEFLPRLLSRPGQIPAEQFAPLLKLALAQLKCQQAWIALHAEERQPQLVAQSGLHTATLSASASKLVTALRGAVTTATEDGSLVMALTVDGRRVGTIGVSGEATRDYADTDVTVLRLCADLAQSLISAYLQSHRWRLQAERVLDASLSSSDWLWETDAEGRVAWVSSGAQAHTGLAASSVVGRTMPQINLPPQEDPSNSWKRYREARERLAPFRDLLARRDTPLGLITVSLSGLPVFDEEGNFRGYRGTTSNVTERLQAQQAARAAERLLKEALDSLTAGVMISDPQGQVVLANKVWRMSLGSHMADGAPWPEVVRRIAAANDYPDAREREAFVQWRLGLASEKGEQHEMRWKDRWVLVSDRRLSDGSVVHLSVDITDLKRAELALAESQAQLSAVLGAVPDLWFVLDAQGHYLSCSSQHHPMLLRPWNEVQGQPFAAGVPLALAERVLGAIQQALSSGMVQRLQYELATNDGVGRIFEARISPMPHRQVLYVTRDVTEQTRAADKLRLSEELYRSVALAISDGLLVVTPTLAILAINPAACDILGVEQAAAMNQPAPWAFELLGPDGELLAETQHPALQVLADDMPRVNQIHAVRRPDGERRWVSLNAHPLQLKPEARTFAVVLTFRDITRQRASDLALAQAEQRWQFALEGSGDGVWDWDATRNKLYYSPRWKEMRGYAEHEVTEAPEEWRKRVHPDDLPQVLAAIRRHLRHEAPFYEVEYRVQHKLGHYLWIRDRGKIVSYDDQGRALRIVGTQTDITRSKEAEQALRDKQAAELASQAKSQFLSRMSHEMRTPLNAVIGFAQLLNLNPSALDAATVREYAGHVLEAGEHLLALVDDVLDLQKIEQGAITLQLQPVSLHALVTQATELLAPHAHASQVEFEVQVPRDAWVQADPQRLRQVLLNVGSNAIKYNRTQGRVRWSTTTHGDRLTLHVEDTGSGMSDSQMQRLFQPFERLGRETSTVEGTGLGLIIARSLTQAIGGRLHIDSRSGVGTRVAVELQCTQRDVAAPAATPAEMPVAARRALRMLYVEDNRINALLFEEAMRLHGDLIELRIAEDGDEALVLAGEWQPEVLVLDAHLPGISGFEVLRQLRQLPGLEAVPAYMCSADAMPDDVQRAYEAGFIGYWTKPINVAAVLKDVAHHLGGAAAPT